MTTMAQLWPAITALRWAAHRRIGARAWMIATIVTLGAGRGAAQAPVASGTEAAAALPPAVERIAKLSTSDGVGLAAWYYPAMLAEETEQRTAAPVVILLHALGGSHESVAALARDLQTQGIAVVAPDLRGHGASTLPDQRDAKTLKSADFTAMAMTTGGRIRTDAAGRGDVETVRNWIQSQAEAGVLDFDRLVVVGSGVGAAVAAHWTVFDDRWPDLASGPQGSQVRGLVLVSPSMAEKGFKIVAALTAEPLRKALPVLIIAGRGDADAVKVYEQLKRQRPDGWSDKRAGQTDATQSPKLPQDAQPTLYFRQFDTDLTGDRLATLTPRNPRVSYPAAAIGAFVDLVTSAEP